MSDIPRPPSESTRWGDPIIVKWRTDGAVMRERLRPGTLDANLDWLTGHLKRAGVQTITEDLLYLYWVSLPVFAAFIKTRIEASCQHLTTCGESALGHSLDGLDYFAAHLLELELRIGQTL